MLGHPRRAIRRRDTQRCQVLHVGLLVAAGDLPDLDAGSGCGCVNFVVDVGDIAHEGHALVEHAHQPCEHVENHGRTRVTDMGVAVHGRSADVDRDMLGVERLKRLFLPRQRVVDLHDLMKLRAMRAGIVPLQVLITCDVT